MFRRVLLSFISAVVAVAALFADPAQSGDRQGASWTTASAFNGSKAKGALRDDIDFLQNQWGDEDDTPDPVARSSVAVVWLPALSRGGSADAAEASLRTHPACACPPRAPPGG
jgi:hypothetical protein